MTIKTRQPAPHKPLDVWLKFDDELATEHDLDPDGATHEANTYQDERGYRVEWYLNSVGQVTTVRFDTYDGATRWLEREGFQDFSS